MKIGQLIEELEWCEKDKDVTIILKKRHLDCNDKYYVYDVEKHDFNLLRENGEIKLEITTDA